jgi:hypothetical protein
MTATTTRVRKFSRYINSGHPVFPSKRRTKAALVGGGFHAASTDDRQIRKGYEQRPGAAIGVPKGSILGIDVIDINYKPAEFVNGFDAMAGWERLSPIR